ncbi:MAG TPA: P-loop NTPase [Solirubrobacteraceae bacterium]|jgi:Mrp family chromosome partitioning ATPase|nr:P-loop NTPase [Solirubrobacteraceae bacterium]
MASESVGRDGERLASAEQAIGPYLRAIRRHWILVAVITVLAGLVAGITATRGGSTYQASSSILVTPLPEGQSSTLGIGTVVDTGDPARTIQTAAALIDTQQAAQVAAQTLGHGWTAGRVKSSVGVTPLGASNVVAVTADASNPADAARVANAFAKGAIAYRGSVVQKQVDAELASLGARLAQLPPTSAEAQALATTVSQLRTIQGSDREPTLSVSELAAPPGGPTGASTWLIVLLALAGGFVLGSVAALALETFIRPVRDRAEVLSIYDLPVLAAIPRVRKKRGRDLLPWNLPPIAFEQMRMLRVQLSLGKRGRVIMVTSAGAGDGKTTVAAALAAAFAEVNDEVVLMDLDMRRPELTRLLGPTPTVDGHEHAELANGAPDGAVAVRPLPGVKLVPAPKGDLAKLEAIIKTLPAQIAQAKRKGACVIIDTAPVGEVSEALQIAAVCDQVVVVARPRHTDRRRLRMARDLLDRAHAPTVGMVLVAEDASMVGGDYGYGYSTGLGPMLEDNRVEDAEVRAASSETVRGVEPG